MRRETVSLLSLERSLEPLQEFFNANADTVRFLGVVSPTCGPCVEGSRAVKRSMLEAFPQAKIAAGLVWIDMLPEDNREAASRRARPMQDARMRQFYDPRRRAGRAIAESLGWSEEVAWDVYLFYYPGERWAELPPKPVAWVHQLGGWAVAPADHFRTGEELGRALRTEMERAFSPNGAPQDSS